MNFRHRRAPLCLAWCCCCCCSWIPFLAAVWLCVRGMAIRSSTATRAPAVMNAVSHHAQLILQRDRRSFASFDRQLDWFLQRVCLFSALLFAKFSARKVLSVSVWEVLWWSFSADGAISIAEMLFSTSIVAVVGAGEQVIISTLFLSLT